MALKVTRKYINTANELISELDLNEIPDNAQPGTIIRSKDVRIDLQGMFSKENQRFANIQIQMNIPRPKKKKNKSTTIALLLLQAGEHFPVEYIHIALRESLERQGAIILRRIRGTCPEDDDQKEDYVLQ